MTVLPYRISLIGRLGKAKLFDISSIAYFACGTTVKQLCEEDQFKRKTTSGNSESQLVMEA
jgi:hypothetical protein